MTVKTITVTEKAYTALKGMKNSEESFSEAIMRISNKKPLSSFYGILSKETGEKLEKTIIDMRKNRNKSHKTRVDTITKSLK